MSPSPGVPALPVPPPAGEPPPPGARRELAAHRHGALEDPVTVALLAALPELWPRYAELCVDDEDPSTETVFADAAAWAGELLLRRGPDDERLLQAIFEVMARFAEREGPEARFAVIVGFAEGLGPLAREDALAYVGPEAGLLWQVLVDPECLDDLDPEELDDPDWLDDPGDLDEAGELAGPGELGEAGELADDDPVAGPGELGPSGGSAAQHRAQ